MTQSQFDIDLQDLKHLKVKVEMFPIRRLRAPITEAAKKEEPKNEFNELLKFYGARFKDGGEVRQGIPVLVV